MSAKVQSDQWRLQTWLRIDASAKPKVYRQVFGATDLGSLSYWLEIFLSAGIATFGLVENSPAVIIGAMLISPLMGPIMATGLALAVGDVYLGIKSVVNLLISVTVSIAFSGFLVWILPYHSATSEIISRTNPDLLDLGIALFSGLAGSVVVCRGGTGGVTAIPGVAIAVALMPPLCAMGFGLGSGPDLEVMGGAGLLFLTNLVAIVACAFLVFLLVGMSTGEVQKEMLAARGEEPLARLFRRATGPRAFVMEGRPVWRVVMILILLASLAVPLRRALLQVAEETVARGAVQRELKRLVPAIDIISQQVTVDKHAIVIRLISTRAIPDAKIAEARQNLISQTGYDVNLSVEAIERKSDLAELLAHLARPAPVAPTGGTAGELGTELLEKVRPLIQTAWPSDAPIQDLDVTVGTAGTALHVRYEAAGALSEVRIDAVLQSLRTELGMPNLALSAERIPTPKAGIGRGQH